MRLTNLLQTVGLSIFLLLIIGSTLPAQTTLTKTETIRNWSTAKNAYSDFKKNDTDYVNGKVTAVRYWNADTVLKKWVPYYKETISYDAQGRLLQFTSYDSVDGSGRWYEAARTDYRYSPDGMTRIKTDSKMVRDVGGTWKLVGMDSSLFVTAGEYSDSASLKVRYAFEIDTVLGAWKAIYVDTVTLREIGSTYTLFRKKWNTIELKWIKLYRWDVSLHYLNYGYVSIFRMYYKEDSTGVNDFWKEWEFNFTNQPPVSYRFRIWDTTYKQWVNIEHIFYTRDSLKNIIADSVLVGTGYAWNAWYHSFKRFFRYDSLKRITYRNDSLWDTLSKTHGNFREYSYLYVNNTNTINNYNTTYLWAPCLNSSTPQYFDLRGRRISTFLSGTGHKNYSIRSSIVIRKSNGSVKPVLLIHSW